jgi:hypothetical protein
MEERLQTILGIIELLKSDHTKLGDYCDSLITIIANEYGIDRTNEIRKDKHGILMKIVKYIL